MRSFAPRDAAQVERAAIAATTVAEQHPGALVFLGGAPMAGLGTAHSDVDLFLVTGPGAAARPRQHVVSGLRVDTEEVELEELVAIVDCVGANSLTTTDLSQLNAASRTRLDVAVRFATGRILADDGTLEQLRTQVLAQSHALQQIIVSRLACEASNNVEDVCGFVEQGDLNAATHMSRLALLAGAEAALTRLGDVYLGPKWVWQRWRRTAAGAFPRHLDDLIFADSGAAEIDARLWAVQDLLCFGFGVDGYAAQPPPVGLPVRDRFTVPLATTDGVLMYRPGRSTPKISRQGLWLWAVAHGRERAEAIGLASKLLAEAGFSVTAEGIAEYYDGLCRIGLISANEH